MEKLNVDPQEHHHQKEFCLTRPKYRQGKKLLAVKVYTVNHESKYILVCGVPSIKIGNEFENLCRRYGEAEVKPLPDYPTEDYTECFMVKYDRIKCARFAKIQLDGRSFFGGVLHVCYAPELETVDDTREKLQERRKSVAALTRYQEDPSNINLTKKHRGDLIKKSATHRVLNRWNIGNATKLRNNPNEMVPDSKNLTEPEDMEDSPINIVFNKSKNELVTNKDIEIEKIKINKDIEIKEICFDHDKEQETKRKFNENDTKYPKNTSGEKKKIKLFGNTKNILLFKK